MRRKKHKHTRRNVSFYKMHYGFKEPFKVRALPAVSCLPRHPSGALGAALCPCMERDASP